jgi:AcrR family transcriptional regulator
MPSDPTPGLSSERIVAAALAIVDEHGWDGFSMRRLAQELDVWPMAVYRYFRDKDELADAVVAAAAGRVELPDDVDWRDRLRALLVEARLALGGIDHDRAGRALETSAGRRLTAAAHAALAEGGFDKRPADRAWRALFGFAIGYPGFVGDRRDQFAFGLDRLLDGVLAAETASSRPSLA